MTDWRQWIAPIPTHTPDVLRLVYRNGAEIGEIVKDVDGYWKYGASAGRSYGLWDASNLEMIAQMLNDLNAAWDAEIQAFFDEEEK